MMLKSRGLSALLAGTAFVVFATPLRAQADEQPDPAPDDAQASRGGDEGDTIIVTGTRIRGARVVGEAVSVDREAIVEAGQIDLGEAIRSLPQNFSGGQNPGVGSGAGLANSNVNSASSANLRGLGPDATLTLLNGHRLPYDSAFAGVDISAIPLAAVDRIEVVPDGASALYGSDAVAGVVNVVLRRDFEGVATSGQLGASTSGGNFRQQADIIGGTRWSGGGAFIAYDFANNSAIEAADRSYAASLDPDTTLYPAQRRHAITVSGHHVFAGGVEIALDALYSNRRSTQVAASPTLRSVGEPKVESYTLAPSVKFDLWSGWRASVVGVFGRDRTNYSTAFTRPGLPVSVTEGCFCNEMYSLEAGAEGPLLELPGGDVRLAIGAGLRSNRLDFTRVSGGNLVLAFDEVQRARFVYGELFVPVVSPTNAMAGVDELSLSAAARYEDYPGLDRLTTPRLGLVYAPFDGLKLRATWARSFKAPTLYQRFIPYQTILLPAAAFGAGPGTVLFTSGGNPDVTSERARSWTAGLDISPPALPELTMSATWYDIRYKDRVVSPIAGSIATAFQDPGFADLIDFSPDPARLDELIEGSLFGLENFSGGPYDPASVVAFIDNRNINVAVWAIEGIDARLSWNQSLGKDRSWAVEVSASWLDSKQQLTADLPDVQLAGVVFNPPKFRARASGRIVAGDFTATLAANYSGALVDRRFAAEQRVEPGATFDLGLSYDIIRGDGRDPRLSIAVNIQNLFNDEPPLIGQTGPTDTPYDSTNYSPIGRFVSFGIRRQW
jgi:outer membrane receptor protein involved in Fe transport